MHGDRDTPLGLIRYSPLTKSGQQMTSGEPIASPEGKNVSIPLGGNTRLNEIYGLPLAQYTQLLGLV